MNFVVIGVLVLIFIGFLVIIWKAARDWRWYNLVGAIFAMLLSIIFMFPTAGALKARQAWHKIFESSEARAEKELAENRIIQYGDPTDPTAGPGLLSLAQQLAKVGIEAGRRWRGMRASGSLPNIQLAKVQPAPPPGLQPDPDAAAAPAPTTPLIPVGLVVYAFAESQVQTADGQLVLPTFFLGEFEVTASTPTGASVKPTSQLEPSQLQRLSAGQATSWSVYELLPLDAHDPFVAEGSSPGDDNIYGRIDDTLVTGLLTWTQAEADRLQELTDKLTELEKLDPPQQLPDAEHRQYTALKIRNDSVQSYLRDGSRVAPEDPPISRWVKVEFIKNWSKDVDSPEQRGALDGSFFDKGTGRATDSRLRRGGDGKVKFKTGDQLIVIEAAAKELIDVENVAKLIDTYYVRPLNNYRFVLRRIRLRLAELAKRTEELSDEEKILNAALAATKSMLTTNQGEKKNLEEDLAQTEIERKSIKKYHDKLAKDLKAARETLVSLYQRNLQLEQQLRKAHSSVLNSAQ